MLTSLSNYRRNLFIKLFDKPIEVAGMAGAHNNYHLGTYNELQVIESGILVSKLQVIESGRLASFKLLRKKNRLVYINLHEYEDFQEEAKQVGLEYHWLTTADFAKAPIPVITFERIYDIVREATRQGKQVTIACGAGSGRTGTALASLKVRELLEEEFRNSSTLVEETQAPDFIFGYTPCTPLVKQAIGCIRNERLLDPEDDLCNGAASVETDNDIRSLINYEQHLRRKLAVELSLNIKGFASEIFGPNVFAGPHPMKYAYKAAVSKNLPKLKQVGIKKIYSLEEEGNDLVSTQWSSYGSEYEHITSESKAVNYFIKDFKTPSLEQIDSITDSILSAIARNEKIYLHCMSGIGRTGTILAALYMKKTRALADDAILFVRNSYERSAIETDEQENALRNYEKHLRTVPVKPFAPDIFGSNCLIEPHPRHFEKKTDDYRDWSFLERESISLFSIEEWNDANCDFQAFKQMDLIIENILDCMEERPSFLHCNGNIGKTGAVLAAVYMKKTGALAEEAIDFVRENYDCHAIENKEQVEVLIRYGRFLNNYSMEEEIHLRTEWLQGHIKKLPNHLNTQAGVVLDRLSHNSIPRELVYEALVQTVLLIRSEPSTTNWVSKYKCLAEQIYAHPNAACKNLGLAMYALATTASVVLATLVGFGTLGLGVPVIAGFGCAALAFFPSHKLYKTGLGFQTLKSSMDDFVNGANSIPLEVK